MVVFTKIFSKNPVLNKNLPLYLLRKTHKDYTKLRSGYFSLQKPF